MEQIKKFVGACIDKLKANPTLAIVLALLAVFIVVVCIVIISLSVKRSQAKKRLAKEAQQRVLAQQKAKEAEEQRVLAQQKAKEAEEQRVLAEQKAKEAEEQRVLAEQKADATAKLVTEKETLKTEKTKRSTKSTTVKTTTEKTKPQLSVKAKADKAPKYTGKWAICRIITDERDAEEMYFFELRASNGEKLLSSEEYTSYNGAIRGIETHKANILKGNFKITLSKKGDYIFKLLSGKNTLLCMGEKYPSKARCESAIESAKRFAETAVIDENVEEHIFKMPPDNDADFALLPDGYNGKWIISSCLGADNEKVFYFELFANNGEKLLSSEEYSSYIGAVNGIQTHKTNIEKGNFRISLTKRGDYIYKLLNGNGQLLCLGEHYKTKRRCLNAVESVKRFAANSPVLTDSAFAK